MLLARRRAMLGRSRLSAAPVHACRLPQFVMAVVHIVISMLVLLLAHVKLRSWHKAGGGDAEDGLAAAALGTRRPAAALAQHAPAAAGGAAAADDVAHKQNGAAVVVLADEAAAAGASSLAVSKWRGRPEALQVPAEAPACMHVPRTTPAWRSHRQACACLLQGPLDWLREGGELVLRQLLLGIAHPTVTRQEFSVLR